MGVSSLPKTVTRQLNPGPSVSESSMLTTQLASHPGELPINRLDSTDKAVIASCPIAQMSAIFQMRLW